MRRFSTKLQKYQLYLTFSLSKTKIRQAPKNPKGSLTDKKLRLRSKEQFDKTDIKANKEVYLTNKSHFFKNAPLLYTPLIVAGKQDVVGDNWV